MNRETAPSYRRLHTALRIAAALSFCVFLLYAVHWMPKVTHGFTMYYVYSRMLIEGDDLGKAFDPDYFNAKVRSYGITDVIDYPNNPPTTALALVPLAWLPPSAAKTAWTTISLILYAFSLLILLRLCGIGLTTTPGLALSTLFFAWRPAYESIALGQLYALLLFLVCLSMVGLNRKSFALLGLPISATILLKGYGFLPALWLAITRRWKAFWWTIAGTGAVVASAWAFLTPGSWSEYYARVVRTMGMLPPDAHVAYQTINGFVHHLFSYDAQWLPHPLLALPPGVVMGMSVALNILLVLHVVGRHHGQSPEERTFWFSAVIAAGVVTAPLAEDYHFVLFLPYVFGVCTTIWKEYSVRRKPSGVHWICLAAIAIIAMPLQYKELQFASFPIILLAYPKLYAGVALLLMQERIAVAQRNASPEGVRSPGQPQST